MEDFNKFLQTTNSLSMSSERWARIQKSPGWVRDSFIGVDHFSEPDGSLEVVEYMLAQACWDGQKRDEFQLSLLLDCGRAESAEVDYGGGSYHRPAIGGQFMMSDITTINKIQGDGPFHSIAVLFSREQFLSQVGEFTDHVIPTLEPLLTGSFRDDVLEVMIKGLLNSYRKGESDRRVSLDSRLRDISLRLVQLAGNARAGIDDGERFTSVEIQKVVEHVKANVASDLGVEDLAKVAGLSSGHFRRLFRQTTGMSPKQYLTRVRIEMAKRLLRESRAPAAEIAERCGFASRTHLHVEFRRLLAISPHEYRKSR